MIYSFLPPRRSIDFLVSNFFVKNIYWIKDHRDSVNRYHFWDSSNGSWNNFKWFVNHCFELKNHIRYFLSRQSGNYWNSFYLFVFAIICIFKIVKGLVDFFEMYFLGIGKAFIAGFKCLLNTVIDSAQCIDLWGGYLRSFWDRCIGRNQSLYSTSIKNQL